MTVSSSYLIERKKALVLCACAIVPPSDQLPIAFSSYVLCLAIKLSLLFVRTVGGSTMASSKSSYTPRTNVAAGKMCQFKLVLLGESAVGKSSLVLRFVKRLFHEYQESTIGAAFLTQTVMVDDMTVKFEIWDTAGQERYHSLAPMYYRGAQAAIVVYDVTSHDSFVRAKQWIRELQRQANPGIIIALAGNKVDLAARRMVEYNEALSFAEESGLVFMETSAKTAMNVDEMFLAIAKKLPKQDGPTAALGGAGGDSRRLEAGDEKKSGGCCGSRKKADN